MAAKILLGELLIQQNLVSQDIINEALRLQITGYRRLGGILVRMNALNEDQLVEALAKQLEIEPTDPRNIVSDDVRRRLPRHLCRKYDAIPIRLKSNNILEVAMADPSDHQAINDLEQYTGHVIEPRLARHSDITSAISQRIPYSLSDILSPQATTRLAIALCLILVGVVGTFSYRYIQNARFGTVSTTSGSTLYKNHDLMVGFDNSGTINFLGRGAFAQGFYSVSFKDIDALNAFIAKKKADFSGKQQEWLEWVIEKANSKSISQSALSKK
jgi:hypothetical protein